MTIFISSFSNFCALFQDNVAAFIESSNHEQTLLKFQEMINKYRFMETHLLQRRGGLESKIPEIKKSLDLVKLLDVAVGNLVENLELNYDVGRRDKIRF